MYYDELDNRLSAVFFIVYFIFSVIILHNMIKQKVNMNEW